MRKTKIFNFFRLIFKNQLMEKLLASLTQGGSKNSFISKLPLNYTEYKTPSYRQVERSGIKYHLDISDYMEWLVFFGIEAEPRKILYNLINANDTIFDIGANIGELTMNMAKRTNGVVHSFEPDPVVSSKLKNNVNLNDFDNIIINEIGFGDQSGYFSMSPEISNNKGGNRIINGAQANLSPTVVIQKLDDYVDQHKIKRLNLIKIDVEGYELKVLHGGVKTIEKFSPTLFIEVNDRNLRQQGDTAEKLITFVKQYYKKLQFVQPDAVMDTPPDLKNCHFDLIASSNED